MVANPSDGAPAPSAGPFGWIAPHRLGRTFAVLFALAFALSLWLIELGAPLQTDAAPNGIVSYELARSAEAARAILDSWDGPAREAAMLVQGIDFLYLLAYPAAFSLGAILLGRRIGGAWQRASLPLAWAMWAAAPLDAVENWALIAQLQSGPSDGAALLAWACAIPKFALVFVLTTFLLGGIVQLVVRAVRA